jgi:hypothetical protein
MDNNFPVDDWPEDSVILTIHTEGLPLRLDPELIYNEEDVKKIIENPTWCTAYTHETILPDRIVDIRKI